VSGYREYPESVLRQIALVQNALQFGFSLKEIARQAHLLQTVGFILSIIVSGGVVIGSAVLVILRLLSKGGNPRETNAEGCRWKRC
jgi:hypothetical protein